MTPIGARTCPVFNYSSSSFASRSCSVLGCAFFLQHHPRNFFYSGQFILWTFTSREVDRGARIFCAETIAKLKHRFITVQDYCTILGGGALPPTSALYGEQTRDVACTVPAPQDSSPVPIASPHLVLSAVLHTEGRPKILRRPHSYAIRTFSNFPTSM